MPSAKSPHRTILMLKTASHFWPAEGIDDGPRLIPKEVMDEPFASLVRRLLPGHPIGDDAVSTMEKRLKLAARLEAALGQNPPSQNSQTLPPGDAVVEHPPGTSPTQASPPQGHLNNPKHRPPGWRGSASSAHWLVCSTGCSSDASEIALEICTSGQPARMGTGRSSNFFRFTRRVR